MLCNDYRRIKFKLDKVPTAHLFRRNHDVGPLFVMPGTYGPLDWQHWVPVFSNNIPNITNYNINNTCMPLDLSIDKSSPKQQTTATTQQQHEFDEESILSKEVACKLCKEHFDHTRKLASHNCPEKQTVKHICQYCYKEFNTKANLMSHQRHCKIRKVVTVAQ